MIGLRHVPIWVEHAAVRFDVAQTSKGALFSLERAPYFPNGDADELVSARLPHVGISEPVQRELRLHRRYRHVVVGLFYLGHYEPRARLGHGL